MVKIIQAYNFAKQQTYSLNGEILAATIINSNRVAVSSTEQFIEIYDVGGSERQNNSGLDQFCNQQQSTAECSHAEGSGGGGGAVSVSTATSAATGNKDDERLPTKYSLATVGEVVNLIYCDAGNYLLTLEKENVGSPVHSQSTSMSCTSSSNGTAVYTEEETKMFVRVYANISKFPESKLNDLPITIRIASMTTPKAPLVDSIDVIELPLRSQPNLIQCCQTSGNVIVGCKDRIYLYEYTQCTHENTQPRFSYIDFLPFKFFVSLNFVPLKLKLAENVIACANNRYCVAFKVVDVLSNNNNGNNNTGGGAVGFASLLQDDDYNCDVVDIDADEAIESSSESSIVSKASVGPSGGGESFETDSLETTSSGGRGFGGIGIAGVPGRGPIDFNVARMVNSVCGREFEVELKSESEINGAGADSGMGSGSVPSDNQDILIMPTRANDIKIKLVNEAKALNVQRIAHNGNILSPTCDEVQYDVRKLLQICMKTNEASGRIVDILRCIDLKAIYQQRNPKEGNGDDSEHTEIYEMGNQQVPSAVSTTKHIVRRTLKSSQYHNCIGYALLVASSVDGYLYQFCAQGKWYNENEKPIATYSFTAPVLHIYINDYVIYAVTTESVESHTSRIGHKLFNNRFEYPTIAALFPEESNPDINAPVTVVGLCSFSHVQHVCVNRDNLILITNSTLAAGESAAAASSNNTSQKRRSGSGGVEVKRNIAARLLAEAKAKHNLLRSGSNAATQQTVNNEWTLYNLEIPKVEHVVDDLESIAETYQTASSTSFYDLMEEAHVMLRLSLTLQCEKFDAERVQILRSKFLENCKKLANFTIRSKKKEIYSQATGYYKMCNLQLSEIYANYIDNNLQRGEKCDDYVGGTTRFLKRTSTCEINPKAAEELIGLIYTVKVFLLNLGTDRLKASFLNQLVKPFFTPSRVIEQGYPLVPLSLEFLNMFIKYSPLDIPQIMLNSPVLADSISSELINYLRYLEKLTPDENLLLAVTSCRMSNYLLSQETVSKTNRRDLATSLMEHKNVLFDDGTVLFQKQQREELKLSTHVNGKKLRQQRHRQRHQKFVRQHFYHASPSSSSSPTAAQTQGNNGTANSNPIASFSDFAETILLATENPALIEAISDAFIHALCIERSANLEMILQLFLNYIASHIGQKGYQTSQKVFVNILQVYYYDLFDVNPLNDSQEMRSNSPLLNENDSIEEEAASKTESSNSERDNESNGNSNAESNASCGSISLEDRGIFTPTAPGATQAMNGHTANQRRRRIVYDILQEQQSPYKGNSSSQVDESSLSSSPLHSLNEQHSETNLKGLKILFRMYLGRLKALSDLIVDLQSADIEQQAPNEEFLNLRMECIRYMIQHLHDLRTKQEQISANHQRHHRYYHTAQKTTEDSDGRKSIFVPFIPDYKQNDSDQFNNYIRPIPCLLDRPQYLNRLPPFRRSDFSYPNRDEGECEVHFVGWHNELLTLTLKIQSLLASVKIDREIVEEFIAFVQKAPDLIGIDSFLVIVLPKNLAINFMLNFCPEYMWQYGKSCGFTPKHWESLLRKIVDKQDILPNWKANLTEILNNLVAELSFEELLQCFPCEVIENRNAEQIKHKLSSTSRDNTKKRDCNADVNGDNDENGDVINGIRRDHFPMDNIDEDNVFELTLRKAVSKQRSIALRSMIESTGTQLFEATSNPMYNL